MRGVAGHVIRSVLGVGEFHDKGVRDSFLGQALELNIRLSFNLWIIRIGRLERKEIRIPDSPLASCLRHRTRI